MTNEKLQELGLSEKEARIYLALIELGSVVVSDIAKKAGVNRSTAYVVLEMLSKRGLVSAAEQRGGKSYSPASPERLIAYLEGTAKQYAGLANVARKLAPELKALSKRKKETTKNAVKPNVQFFEGREGIQTVYESTLASLEKIRTYASVEDRRESKEKSKARVIFLNTPEAREQVLRTKETARGAFLAPRKSYSFSPEINIYDNKIVFISPAEKCAFVVESPELAETLKRALDLAGRETTKLNKKMSLASRPATGGL